MLVMNCPPFGVLGDTKAPDPAVPSSHFGPVTTIGAMGPERWSILGWLATCWPLTLLRVTADEALGQQGASQRERMCLLHSFGMGATFKGRPRCGGGQEEGTVSILQGAGEKSQHGLEPATPRRKFSLPSGPSEKHGFPDMATGCCLWHPREPPHRQASPKLNVSLTNNSVNFSLPSGFTHRECILECPRRFQNFLRMLECLYPPTRQPGILLQGARRLQALPLAGSSSRMTVQRLGKLYACDLRCSNFPATQYILPLLHFRFSNSSSQSTADV